MMIDIMLFYLLCFDKDIWLQSQNLIPNESIIINKYNIIDS